MACVCGRPVRSKRSGECSRCYNRRWYHSLGGREHRRAHHKEHVAHRVEGMICKCGHPVGVKSAGACRRCYNREYRRAWIKTPPGLALLARRAEKIRAKNLRYDRAHKEESAARHRTVFASIRARVLAAYGGCCVCCGEAEPRFLSVDHINGGGHLHRKAVGSGCAFYYWLKRQGYPKDDFRLLCHNCNQAMKFRRPCPHEEARVVEALLAA
jgi:hypothetical protein